MGIELSARTNDHGFQKKRDSSCSAFLDAFYRVPPLYLPIYQPLAYYANRPRAIFQRPIVPRKRHEEHNKGEKKAHERKFIHHKLPNLWSLMSGVMLGKGSTPGGQRPW